MGLAQPEVSSAFLLKIIPVLPAFYFGIHSFRVILSLVIKNVTSFESFVK